MKKTIAGEFDATTDQDEVGFLPSPRPAANEDAARFSDGGDTFPLAAGGSASTSAGSSSPVASIATLATWLVNGFWQNQGALPHHWASSTITYNLGNLNAQEQALASSALSAWQQVANISFVQTSGAANISFNHNGTMQAVTNASWTGSGAMTSATVDISTDWVTTDGGANDGKTGIDSYAYQTYIHELGHALGLGHQGPYNGSASYSTDAIYANDTWQYSIMSYFSENNYSGSSYRYVITPQVADIYAVAMMYGAATTTRTGDTVYGFNNTAGSIYNFSSYSQAPALTIYDSGGTDTLDCSGYSNAQTIDLRAGNFSSVGGLKNNIGIALGVTIEKAIGGSGNDTLIANDAGCTLTGGGGNDTIIGGTGTDTAVYSGLKSNYAISYNASTQIFTLVDNRAGSPDGTDTVSGVEYFQFADGTFAGSVLLAPPNNPPNTPVGHNQTVASGTSIALSALFTGLTDPDSGDSVTQVWVSDRTAGNGHLTFNGTVLNDNQAYGPIAINQLSQWAFLAGGTDTIAFQTVDSHGAFSATAFATVTLTAAAPVNNPPNTPVGHDQTVASGTSVALSTLFTGLTDPDSGDSVTQVWVSDRTAGNGHLTYNGTVLNDNRAYGPIAISQLSQWAFQAGGTDTIAFQTVDSHGAFSATAFATVSISPPPNNPPNTPVGHNQTVVSGTSVALSTLFTGLTDPDSGDSVTQVYVSDTSAGGGHLTFNGVVQNDNQMYGPIPIGQLGQWAFQAGGTDTIAFETADSHGALSAIAYATVTATPPNNPPNTPVGHNQTVASGTSVALSTLFTGLTDPDSGDSVTQVYVSDTSAGGGHLTFNGVVQNDNQVYGPIPIGQLSQWAFQAGGTDTIAFQTADSHGALSAMAYATVTVPASPPPNSAPDTPVGHNQTVALGTSIALSTLFTGLTDPDSGDSVTQVWVSDRTAGNGHLTFNGVVQNDNQAYGPIPISQLSQWAFQAGGTDTIAFQTVDSHGAFSATAFATVTTSTTVNNPPNTPVGHNQSVASGALVALSTLFTGLTDPDSGDSVTQVWVSDRTAGNGHLTFNGTVLNDNQAYGPIPISQLGQWAFQAGGTDTIAFQTVDSHGAFSATAFATVTASGSSTTVQTALSMASGFDFRPDLGSQATDLKVLDEKMSDLLPTQSLADDLRSLFDAAPEHLPAPAPEADNIVQKVLAAHSDQLLFH